MYNFFAETVFSVVRLLGLAYVTFTDFRGHLDNKHYNA